MGRWEPDARGRLEEAAMALFAERGYEQTTVADIAERAGLTKRTFFRHYADKRDVLFSGSAALQELIVNAVAAAPDDAPPIEAVAAGLAAAATALQHRVDIAPRRQRLIAENSELQERELVKFAVLAAAIAGVLRKRGVEPRAASLAGEAGMAVLRVGFDEWVTDIEHLDLGTLFRQAFAALRNVTAGE
ncbi:MAG: helix-turn-helix domain-containing protein [Actinocrinis sp.]